MTLLNPSKSLVLAAAALVGGLVRLVGRVAAGLVVVFVGHAAVESTLGRALPQGDDRPLRSVHGSDKTALCRCIPRQPRVSDELYVVIVS